MSLILDNQSTTTWNMLDGPGGDYRDVQLLSRYLAIMEANKASSRFVPNDALMALDMAGFVRDRISGLRRQTQVSAARMALALVQPVTSAPVQ